MHQVNMQRLAASHEIFDCDDICFPTGVALLFAVIYLRHCRGVNDYIRFGKPENFFYVLAVRAIHRVIFAARYPDNGLPACRSNEIYILVLLQKLCKLLTEEAVRTCHEYSHPSAASCQDKSIRRSSQFFSWAFHAP